MRIIFLTIPVLLVVFSASVSPYKILLLPLGSAGKSHIFSFTAIAQGLADRGHSVSFFIPNGFTSDEALLKNNTSINVIRYKDSFDGTPVDYESIFDSLTRSLMEKQAGMSTMTSAIQKQVMECCEFWTMHNEELLDNMKKERYDVAIVDGLFFFKCIYLIPHRLQVPFITYADVIDPLLTRVPWLPSFVPNSLIPFTASMTFIQRMANVLAVFGFSVAGPFFTPPLPPGVKENYQQYGSFSSLDELVSKSVLWLYTKDRVIDYPRPMMPNIIDVGGLTVKRSTGKIPHDIKKFIEGSKKGTILVTFGSTASSFPVGVAEKFLSAFSQLDGYRVMWRMKNTDGLEIPENVLIARWLPQNDILAHPSVKLFITHSGNNGQLESMYNGVPMIGFPIGGDQMYNAKRLDYRGFGLSMDLYDFTVDQLLDNIYKILGDKSYKERIMKASEIFRSQAQSPAETAAFWVEHVCRFGGDHLRSAGNDLPLYSYLMLDIIAFILVSFHILFYVVFKCSKYCLRKFCARRAVDDKTKKTD